MLRASEINGVLKGYELQFRSSEEKEVFETVYLGPTDTHYKTTVKLMKPKIEVRVCAALIGLVNTVLLTPCALSVY